MSSSNVSPWADDVELDDDMMFHNDPVRHENAIMSDEDDDDDDVAIRSESDLDSDLDDVDDDSDYYYLKMRKNAQRNTDTDDEDWQSMGAAQLRLSPADLRIKEQEAIDALVQLRSV